MRPAFRTVALGAVLGAVAALLVPPLHIEAQGPAQPATPSQCTTAPAWRFPDRRTLTEYPGP